MTNKVQLLKAAVIGAFHVDFKYKTIDATTSMKIKSIYFSGI